MKSLLSTVALLALVSAAADANAASSSQSAMKTCSANWTAMSDVDKKATTRTAYMSGCMKSGGTATAPAKPATVSSSVSGGSMSSCAASWKGMSDTSKKATTYRAYMSACMKGGTSAAMAPAAKTAAAPATKPTVATPATSGKAAPVKTASKSSKIPTEGNSGTSARCKDGKVIPIKSHVGACSHRGGVAAWL